jgi:hypothetical protein
VVLVGTVVVVSAAGFAAFLALNWRAASSLGSARAAVAGAGAAALDALFWALVHGLTLRSDLRFLSQVRGVEAAEPPVAAAGVSTAAPAAATAAAASRVLPPLLPQAACCHLPRNRRRLGPPLLRPRLRRQSGETIV